MFLICTETRPRKPFVFKPISCLNKGCLLLLLWSYRRYNSHKKTCLEQRYAKPIQITLKWKIPPFMGGERIVQLFSVRVFFFCCCCCCFFASKALHKFSFAICKIFLFGRSKVNQSMNRLQVVSNFGDGDSGAGKIHTRARARNFEERVYFARPTITIAKIRDYSQSNQ